MKVKKPTTEDKVKAMDLESLHRKLWTWIAESGNCHKDEWPFLVTLTAKEQEYIWNMNICFACIAAGSECDSCPITWTFTEKSSVHPCECKGSIYHNWRMTSNVVDRKRLAATISKLSWKETKR